MKNKEKYNVEDLRFCMINHVQNGKVLFWVEHLEEGWELDYEFSISSILKSHIEEIINSLSTTNDEIEWFCEDEQFADDFATIHVFNRKTNQEVDMKVSIPALIETALSDWSDAWLEEDVMEDEEYLSDIWFEVEI